VCGKSTHEFGLRGQSQTTSAPGHSQAGQIFEENLAEDSISVLGNGFFGIGDPNRQFMALGVHMARWKHILKKFGQNLKLFNLPKTIALAQIFWKQLFVC
jgi:hypothetical protein